MQGGSYVDPVARGEVEYRGGVVRDGVFVRVGGGVGVGCLRGAVCDGGGRLAADAAEDEDRFGGG